ncbi:MAG TPA: preQ(1) synthase [Chthoniobacterales bacterium]|nr:preQ(1) synthase [Chthoniobacterales bacterium]
MPVKKKGKYDSLTLLGRPISHYPSAPSAQTIETFPNEYPNRNYLIKFECADFTSLCPITGQPDFAKITIEYVPSARCIETKSLKFYLASYRNTRSFNEEIVNRILDDVVTACSPHEALVYGEFASRGGIKLSVEASYPDALATPGDGQRARKSSSVGAKSS